jgi:two-component system, sensor histidine kinase and response regulator
MSMAEVDNTAWSYVLDEPTRILVADDDPILCEFAIVHLSSPAAVIETAPDGATALAMLNNGQFDVALLDIGMPGIDGFSLLHKIRAEPKLAHLPVMMLTGNEDIASIDRAYGLGANAFVTKPVNWRLLSYRIRYVLRHARLEQELRRARSEAEANEASYKRMLLGLEVECRDVLKGILSHASSLHDGSSSTRATLQAIRSLAGAALSQFDRPPAATSAGHQQGAGVDRGELRTADA